MKKIRLIAILLLIVALMSHAGCMNTDSPARGSITGLVTDSSGNPLSAVKVYTTEAATFSDVYGKWALTSLTPQLTEITAARENYQTQTQNIDVVSGETVSGVNFALPADSEIYDIQVTGVTSSRARITFYTKFQARASVSYGVNALFDKTTPTDAELIFLHQYELTNLNPASSYRFKCVATDKTGRRLESEIKTFNTLITTRGEPPVGLKLSKAANSNAIVLNWNSDAGADFAGFAIHKSNTAQGPFNRLGTVTNQNTYIDNDVLAGNKYYYRVTRLSGSGDESSPSNTEAFVMPGVMTSNAVWTSQESPYYLTGDLTIAANASLIIDKGVTVAIAKGDQWDADSADDLIDISVQGTLMVQGTSLQPVTMTSSAVSPQSGDWNGITFENVSDLGASLIKGLRLSYAQNGINGVAGLPEVKESSFNSCRQAAVKMTSARRDQAFRSLVIETCGSGIDLQSNLVKVQILDCQISRCINSIICRGNKLAEVERNRISLSGACGIDLGNTETASKARYNVIGYGSGGIGIICRGKDEVRRNTVQANVGIEIKETAQAVLRSNLILADNSRNGVGIMYSGSVPYNPSTATNTQFIQNNGIWNAAGNRKYANSDGTALTGYSGDLSFTELAGPGLQGGDPFASQLNEDFNYKPSSGSPVKGAGYDYETIGAEDVPD